MSRRPMTRLRNTLALLALSCWSLLSHAVDLPNIGETAESYLSTEEEQRLGREFMRNLRQTLRIVDDPEVQNYIQALGYRLVANSGIPVQGRTFTFFVVNDPAINAFAGPGGYIGINTGLILTTESESELASVIAHEVAHVTQRHLARTFEAASRMSLPMTAAIIAAIILGQKSGQLGEAAAAAAAAGSIQQQINFTRANEQEADRIGLQILANSGFDPRAMPRFFERLQRAGRLYDDLQLEFLRTHPVTTARIADTRNRAEQYPVPKTTEQKHYELIRAKLRVIQEGDIQKTLEYFETALRDAPAAQQDALRYGYALALYIAGRLEEARTQLAPLIAKDPERITYQIANAEIEYAAGHLDEALKIYERNLALYPFNLPLTVAYAQALLGAGRAGQAQTLITEYLRHREPSAVLYRLLARAAGETGRQIEAHQALAEYYFLLGETRMAMEQLEIALRKVSATDDRNLEARIRARLRELENEWRIESGAAGQ